MRSQFVVQVTFLLFIAGLVAWVLCPSVVTGSDLRVTLGGGDKCKDAESKACVTWSSNCSGGTLGLCTNNNDKPGFTDGYSGTYECMKGGQVPCTDAPGKTCEYKTKGECCNNSFSLLCGDCIP